MSATGPGGGQKFAKFEGPRGGKGERKKMGKSGESSGGGGDKSGAKTL